MNLRESVGIALGALRANKLRSFLTLLGTIIGVMSVIAVVSIVEGLNRYVSQKLLNVGANVFEVDKYGFITSQDQCEAAIERPDVTLDDADALRERRPPRLDGGGDERHVGDPALSQQGAARGRGARARRGLRRGRGPHDRHRAAPERVRRRAPRDGVRDRPRGGRGAVPRAWTRSARRCASDGRPIRWSASRWPRASCSDRARTAS